MPLITTPPTTFRAKSKQVLVVSPITLPSGRALTDWDNFLLTWREDPLWPRVGYREAASLDPTGNNWTSVLSLTLAAGSAIVGSTLEFPLTASQTTLAAGEFRYAFDVRGLGGTAGEVPLIDARWITLLPRVG